MADTSRSGEKPKIVVKEEPPSSPSLDSQSKPRPRKLDLSASTLSVRQPGGPMTARELDMHEVGLACLSPGFQTQDPVRQEQLQRSMTVREQQRSIIESRLQKSAKGDGHDNSKSSESKSGESTSTRGRKRPPPNLSIVPPAASQFANERVVQSAPLNKTFTGRNDPPLHARNQTNHNNANLSAHQGFANQNNNNRLPPLADVFGSDLGARDRDRGLFSSGAGAAPSAHSNVPGYSSPPGSHMPRPREYRSAEEAVHDMSGGREDLLPRMIHYSGHRQVTPPNNGEPHHLRHSGQSSLGRRSRAEYEQDHGSPPLGNGPDMRSRNGPGPAAPPHGPFGAGRDSPETQRRKKEEFLALCARAWDLFHS